MSDVNDNLWMKKAQFKSVMYNMTVLYLLCLQCAFNCATVLGYTSHLGYT